MTSSEDEERAVNVCWFVIFPLYLSFNSASSVISCNIFRERLKLNCQVQRVTIASMKSMWRPVTLAIVLEAELLNTSVTWMRQCSLYKFIGWEDLLIDQVVALPLKRTKASRNRLTGTSYRSMKICAWTGRLHAQAWTWTDQLPSNFSEKDVLVNTDLNMNCQCTLMARKVNSS